MRNTNENQALLERGYFNTCFAVIFTMCFLYIIGYFLQYIPNSVDTDYISKHFFLVIVSFQPEAPERAVYIMSTFLFPVLFAFFYWTFSKLTFKPSTILSYNNLFPAVFICELILFISENLYKPYIFKYGLVYKYPLLVIAFSLLLILFMFLIQDKYLKLRTVLSYLGLLVCILCALYVSSLFITDSYAQNNTALFHFNAYYYPVFEVFNGKVLMIDFPNIYGFYPYLLAPILKLTGSITILKFSVIMAVLIFIAAISLLAIVWVNTSNKLIAFISYIVLLYFTLTLSLSVIGGFYLAYQPHRLFFPLLIIMAASFLLHAAKQKQRILLTVIGYILVCVSIIWNLDTGIVVAGAWCLLHIYLAALEYSFNNRKFYKKAMAATSFTILAMAASYLIIALITYAKSGIWISIKECFFYQNIFYNLGINMLPMSINGPWVIVIVLYIIGLVISIRNIKALNSTNTEYSRARTSMLFVISIMGVGLFSYYQGRSHDIVLLSVLWPAVLIAAMLLSDLFNQLAAIKNRKKEYINKRITVIISAKFILLMIFFVSYMLVFPSEMLNDPTLVSFQNRSTSEYNEQINESYKTIKSELAGSTNTDLFIYQQDYYYTMLGLKNQTGLGSNVDWFTREDYDRALLWLRNTNRDLIIDKQMEQLLSSYNEEEFTQIMDSRFDMHSIGNDLYMCKLKLQS